MTSTPEATWTNPFPTPVTNKTTYLADFQYKDNKLEFFPHAEGYIKYDKNQYSYVFNYTDHLGNIRVSYSDIDKNGILGNEYIQECPKQIGSTPPPCQDLYVSAILEENHYYPFGLKHTGYNSDNAQPNYNYKYNGKELQTELGLNMYDYGARNYDPALGRWFGVDPLAEIYEYSSSYVYTLNNPVVFIDPDGNHVDVSDILKTEKNKDGKRVYVNNDLAQAFLKFANSKAGIAFLSNFASKGQKIGNHTYTEAGKFDKANIDLNFGTANLNYSKSVDGGGDSGEGPNGITRSVSSKTKMLIQIDLNTSLNLNNEDAKAYKNNPSKRIDYILSRTITLFHEAYIHAQSFAEDFLDDYNQNDSNIPSSVKDKVNKGFSRVENYSKTYQHMNAREKNSMYRKVVLPALIGIYKNNKVNKSASEVEKKAFNYTN